MKYLLTLIFLLVCSSSVGMDTDKIKNMYDSGLFTEILSATSELQAGSEVEPEAVLYRALAFYRLNNFRESAKLLSLLINDTDNIRVKDTALYFKALSKIKLHENIDGALILAALQNSSFSDIALNSKSILEVMINYRMNDEDLAALTDNTSDKTVAQLIQTSRNSLKILAVLPLSGPDKDAGKEIFSGLEYAVKKLKLSGKKIKLDVVNSEGKIPLMTKKVLDRLSSSRYNLVIGELRSDATAALAGITSQKNIPLLSPTASDKNLSEISDIVFQLNTTSYTLSDLMAGFAIDSLDCKTFTILAPATDDGYESVAGFTEKVTEKGCSIISTEWYFDAYDLKKQLVRIREKLLSLSALDKNEYMTSDSINTYSAGIADAIFLPVPNSDIEPVLSQVSYFNFKAKILGTYGWNDISMLNKMSFNADSLVYIKESSYEPDNAKLNSFISDFRKDTGRNPKDMEITGYSLIEMLLNLQNDNPDRSILENLSAVNEYDALAGRIIFKDKRTNSASEVYTYSAVKKKLKRIFYQENSTPDSFETSKKLFNSGYVHEVHRQYDKAVELYLLSLDELKSSPDYPDSLKENRELLTKILKRLGDAFYKKKDQNNAVKYLSQYLSLVPKDRDAVFKNAAAGSKENPVKSLDVLLRFSDDAEYGPEANRIIGNIYTVRSDSLKAKEYFKKAEKRGVKKTDSSKKSSLKKSGNPKDSKNKSNTNKNLNIDW